MKRQMSGFPMTGLLLVTAVLAVLVAIAVPVMSGPLHRARLATDHADIRAAQAIAARANRTGELEVDGEWVSLQSIADAPALPYYLTADGAVTATAGDDLYRLQASGVDLDAKVCEDCPTYEGYPPGDQPMAAQHYQGETIRLLVDRDGDGQPRVLVGGAF